ncbi:hypothetical protein PDESU_05424 [Pontiella desulfatans]|uniref:SdpI/YhfL protein family protein n=1 Tax=Pontiella desulfatans TaxID=2750659 RepID=A0A6C2U9Q3_PONDE|nr:SdpI family protein [Pontiella desulfatans]VGO16832.1 hypothetical protein PDESU_05424 [Pontiella desulfatans]
MESSLALGISNIAVGTMFMLLSIPLIQCKVSMNKVYGVRIRKAFESEDLWYKINAYGGRQLMLWSILLVLIGIATFFLSLAGNGPLIMVMACMPLIILIPALVAILRFAKKL